MPNWVETRLMINCPAEAVDALLAELAGPCNWSLPLDSSDALSRQIERPALSAHDRYDINRDPEAAIAAFRAGREDWPDLLTPGRLDVERYYAGHDDRPKTVPLSIPRLLPLDASDGIETLLGDSGTDAPFWAPEIEHYGSRICDMHTRKIGTKWTPDVDLIARYNLDTPEDALTAEKTGPGTGTTRLEFHLTTPWSEITALDEALRPVLTRHGATALSVWIEEQGFSGYTYHAADPDAVCRAAFGPDDFTVAAWDDDGDEVYELDRDLLMDRVRADLADTGFFGPGSGPNDGRE